MKDALVELKQLRARLAEVTRTRTEPIAIVGMGCRLPGGADSPSSFWKLLQDGVDAIAEVPRDRWDLSTYYDPNPDVPGRMNSRFGGFLERIDEFDATFFGISPREARSLDPQQRLLLEVTWEALERSGQSPAELYGSSTGVFIGMSTFDYALHQVGGAVEADDLDRIDGYVATGSTMSPAAGRLSYVLGLNGPSMVVDTACSSSLVAAHLAVTSLRNRECDLALVGGVNLILRPEWNVNFTKAHMLAPDGRCKTFDAAADGYTRGEGCGVVVLQRLSDAQAAKRTVVAVIRGSAVNQDGASGGLTVPSGPSQEQVIRRALEQAGVPPGDVGYVEAHGTGTALGEPIEVAALGAVYGPGRSKRSPLTIGSVKTNVGHLEAAAGVTGLIKVALSLQQGEIPPHLHYRRGNPMIDWEGLPVVVPVARTPWPAGNAPRRAGLSSFGFTGTNAHMILESAPEPDRDLDADSPERGVHILTCSARTSRALEALAARYERHLGEHSDQPLGDVAQTAATGRTHFRHRLAVVARSYEASRKALQRFAQDGTAPGVFVGPSVERPRLAFLFTGQGAQYVGMGRALFETEPLFRETLEQCDGILRSFLERPLLDVLYAGSSGRSPLDDTAYTQPALFAVEYALASLWRSWGVEPAVVMGHSVGEYAAACVAGVFSLEDGLRLVAERARLMQALPDGGQMVAVQASEEEVMSALRGHETAVAVAAVNAPASVVVSGTGDAIRAVTARLASTGIATQRLRVSHAFHSPLMEPMLGDFSRVAAQVPFATASTELISNLSGQLAGPEIGTADYWVRHARQPVRFANGMQALHRAGCRVFVEIGPASTLLALGRQNVSDEATAWLPSLSTEGDWDRLARSLAALYVAGLDIDWRTFHRGTKRRAVALPTYPFQRQRHWIDVKRRQAGPAHEAADIEGLVTTLEWRASPPVTGGSSRPPGRWVILADEQGVGTALGRAMSERGASVAVVSAGEPFGAEFTSGAPVSGVVCLWGLDDGPLERVAPGTSRALERLLQLIRTLAGGPGPRETAVWCVTKGAMRTGHEPAAAPVAVAQAPLWGFGRSLALELPGLWGGLVDLDPSERPDANVEALADDLLAAPTEDQFAYRGMTRYVPRLTRQPLRQVDGTRLDPDGVYLIVGGLGALGGHAARWLVSRGARRLVLAGRRGLDAPGADQAARTLESLGAHVTVVRADVSSPSDVTRILAEAGATGAPVRGIVHAAGLDAPTSVVEMTVHDLRRMLASKVAGAWNLHSSAPDVEWLVLFSSVSAVWGSPGRAHYAAANAFLDALAQERRRQGLVALSVNWGPWLGGGMARDGEVEALERLGQRGLEPAAALRALDALFDGGATQGVVSDVDWPRFRTALEARRPQPILSEVAHAAASDAEPSRTAEAAWLEQLQSMPAESRRASFEHLLRTELAAILGFDRPDDLPIDQSVFDLGIDSLRAVELTVRLRRHLGIQGTVSLAEFPLVSDLAGHLLERLDVPALQAITADGAEGIVACTTEREPEVFEFAREVWPERPVHLIEPRWRWMFLDSARRRETTPKVWIHRTGGRVVAHHGAMPVELQVGPDRVDAGWFVDTMVRASHQTTATGAGLLIEANDVFPVGLSLGQTAQIREMARQLGWSQVSPLQTYVQMLRPKAVMRGKVNPVVAHAADLGIRARGELRRRLARRSGAGLEARPVDRFGDRHDRLWEAVKHDYVCAVTRDASYLNWKYVDQPDVEFLRLEFSRDDELVAVVVLAFDDPGSIYQYGRAFIMDIVVAASDSVLVGDLLEHVRETCVTMGSDAILMHLICPRMERLAESAGFLRREPTRFLLVNGLQMPEHARNLLASRDNWLVTMGDSDVDRPWETLGDRIQVRSHGRLASSGRRPDL